jgi:signal transduction histidine kinase
MVAAAALTAGLELQSYVDPEVPRYVRSDSTRIRQILANLLSNAVKFTPEGEVVLEVVPAGDDVVRFVVRDTGIGIAPDRLEQLFEPFTQADAATNRRYGGTGLGLTISRELAGLLGGSISAASELGHGSTFTVELPLRGLSPPDPRRRRPCHQPPDLCRVCAVVGHGERGGAGRCRRAVGAAEGRSGRVTVLRRAARPPDA